MINIYIQCIIILYNSIFVQSEMYYKSILVVVHELDEKIAQFMMRVGTCLIDTIKLWIDSLPKCLLRYTYFAQQRF